MRNVSLRIGLILWLCAYLAVSASATSYTVRTPHLTMHVGDIPPPCIIQVLNGSTQVGAGAAIFKEPPSCSMAVNSSSPAGKYPLSLKKGTLTKASDTQTLVDGTVEVIPVESPSLIGARLKNNISYPPEMGTAPAHPLIDMASNEIANLVGDCTTDNAAAILKLLAFGRGTYTDDIDVNGTSVTALKGVSFVGLTPGSVVEVDGIINHVASISDATHLTLKTPAGVRSRVQLAFPPIVVDTDGSTTVSAIRGATLMGLLPRTRILIGGNEYVVASVTDATHLQTTESVPSAHSVDLYTDQPDHGSFGYISQFFSIPPGCYATSQPIRLFGNYWSLYGSGPQTSIFYLLPNSALFNKGAPVEWFHPQSLHGNENFHEYVINLGFRIGVGNPQAVPITTEMNNMAAFRNVQVWADDSMCPYAFNLRRAYPGPGLLKDMAIYGCTNAMFSNQLQYNITAEGLTVEGQTDTVLEDGGIKLSLRHVLSDNPGLFARLHAHTDVVLLDSKLLNGAETQSAVAVETTASFYGKSVEVSGYASAVSDKNAGGTVDAKANIRQRWSGQAQSLFNSSDQPNSLNLPEAETPPDNDPEPAKWTKLTADTADWQKEIDATRSSTVYLPPGLYTFPQDFELKIPDTINHINFFGGGSRLHMMTLTIAGHSSNPLIIDAAPHNLTKIRQIGSRAIVMRDMDIASYTAQPGSGNVFIENVGWSSNPPVTFYASQSIWARQLNVEPPTGDKFSCIGAKMWVLGYKTEHNDASITESNGCEAEIYGAFFYQLTRQPDPGSAVIKLSDSSLFIAGLFDYVNKSGFGTPNWVNESQGRCTKSLQNHFVNQPGNNLSMFYSYGKSLTKKARQECE